MNTRQCLLYLFLSSPALAHHSPSAFDPAGEFVLQGTLIAVEWKNPHIYLTVASTGTAGVERLQKLEAAPVSSVQTAGLQREDLVLGSHVAIRAFPNRRGEGRIALALDVTMEDGTTYLLNPGGRRTQNVPETTPRAQDLSGNWAPTPESFNELRQLAFGWPLTPAGQEALAAAYSDPVSVGVCEPFPSPMLAALYHVRSIELHEDRVVFRYDAFGEVIEQEVHLDLTEHPAPLIPTRLGHAIGHWEGDTLVIDSSGFLPDPLGVGFGVPSGPGKHMVERLTLAADGSHLVYSYTLDDPDYLSESVSHTAQWPYRPDLSFSNEPCDLENGRLYLEE